MTRLFQFLLRPITIGALLLACFSSQPLLLRAAPAYDNDFFTASSNPSGSPFTTTFTVGAGTNQVLIVSVINETSILGSSVTFGGLPMTFLRSDNVSASNYQMIYYLAAPPAGIQTIKVTPLPDQYNPLIVTAFSYSGVDQTNPIGTTQIGSALTATILGPWGVTTTSITPLSTGSTLLQMPNMRMGCAGTNTLSVGQGAARAAASYFINNYHHVGLADWVPGSIATTSMNATWTDAGTVPCSTFSLDPVIELLPIGGGFPTPTPVVKKLDLLVASESAQNLCTSNYLHYSFKIANSSAAAVDMSTLKIRFWMKLPAGVTPLWVSDSNSGTIYGPGNAFLKGSLNAVFSQSAVVACSTTTLVELQGPSFSIPAGGYIEKLAGTLGLSNSGVWDVGCDDYSAFPAGIATGSGPATGYVEDIHFGLYENGVLLCEYTNATNSDLNSGIPPCGTSGCASTPTQTSTLSPSPTYTPTITPTYTWSATISPTFSTTATITITSSQTPSFSVTATPSATSSQTPGGGDGLTVRYYSDAALLNQVDCLVQPQINFSLGPSVTPIASLPKSVNWSLRANGFVRSDYTETYTFYVAGDDGWRLWINGSIVAEDWNLHSIRTVSGTVTLTAGVKNSIQLEYFQGLGYAALQLSWSSPSVPFAVIPQSSLYSVACGSFTATPTPSPIPVSTLQPDNFNSGLLSPFWTSRSIGLTGSVPLTVTTALTFTAQGCDISDVQDQFSYVFQPVYGDFDVSLKIVAVPNSNSASKTGLMLRSGEESYAPYAYMFATNGNAYGYQDRTTTAGWAATRYQGSGFTVGTPGWVRLRRQNNLVFGYYSPDGIVWTLANAVNSPIATKALLGIASTSASCGVTSSTTVDDFVVLPLATPTSVLTPTPTLPGSMTVYREIFPNSVTYSVDLSDAGWKVLQGTSATAITPTAMYSLLISTALGSPINELPINSFPSSAELAKGVFSDVASSKSKITLFYTDETAISRSNSVATSVIWSQGCESYGDPLKVALRIGTNWFVSQQGFVSGGIYSIGDFNSFATRQQFDITNAQWNSLSVVAGTVLSITAGTVALAGGDITAFGLLSESSTARVRFDNFAIMAAVFTATPTMTNSPTSSTTRTATPTNTSTATMTVTNTPTSTITVTNTQTSTATVTATPTSSSSSTQTWTNTQTSTFTTTASPSATMTASPSSTRTMSPSVTPSVTNSFTSSVTLTSSFTPSTTVTPSISSTPSASPTACPACTPVPGTVQVFLRVFDSSGLEQRTLAVGLANSPLTNFSVSSDPYDPSIASLDLSNGTWIYSFDGKDSQGDVLRNGAYVFELESIQGGISTKTRRTVQVVGAGAPIVQLMVGPNPVQRGAVQLTIQWLPAVPVDLKIYNLDGELVRDLGRVAAGPKLWDLRNDAGATMADGVYWVGARRPGERLPRLFKLMLAR